MNLKQRSSADSIFIRLIPALVLATLLLVAESPAAYAQVDRAVLEGTVTDPTGGVISGATVKAVAVDTGLSEQQQANSRGYYRISGLAVGGFTGAGDKPSLQTK